jgi:hypothetical protein
MGRDIVAHIEHVVFIEAVVFGVLPEDGDLIVDVQEDVFDAQVMQPLPDAFREGAGDDDDAIASPDSQLEGIAVPGTHAADLFAGLEDQYAAIGHNAIDVEYECPYRFKFFQYAHGDNALLSNL